MKEVQIKNRKSGHTLLKDYCGFAKNSDYIEITEWTNYEGYDINISANYQDIPARTIQITCGEFEAIKAIIKKLNED